VRRKSPRRQEMTRDDTLGGAGDVDERQRAAGKSRGREGGIKAERESRRGEAIKEKGRMTK
jgi:hypothetical protein